MVGHRLRRYDPIKRIAGPTKVHAFGSYSSERNLALLHAEIGVEDIEELFLALWRGYSPNANAKTLAPEAIAKYCLPSNM